MYSSQATDCYVVISHTSTATAVSQMLTDTSAVSKHIQLAFTEKTRYKAKPDCSPPVYPPHHLLIADNFH